MIFSNQEDPPMEMVTAYTLRIKSLYNYQRFKTEWLERILWERKIYLSNPKNFNDPWDCRPWYRSETLDDPQVLEKYLQHIDRLCREGGLTESECQERLKAYRENPERCKQLVNQTAVEMWEEISKQYRVYCLSSNPCSTLMWSHYADGHKGICLEFCCNNNELFPDAFKIMYEEKYPLLDFTDRSLERQLVPFITKSSVWGYEDEYRLIAMEEPYADDGVLKTKENFLEIPEGSLKSVIIGCNLEEENKRKVENIIREYGGGVEMKRALHVPDRYDLLIGS